MAMVTDTRYSMLPHPDVRDPISINLKDVTIREALDALRELYGYDYKVARASCAWFTGETSGVHSFRLSERIRSI